MLISGCAEFIDHTVPQEGIKVGRGGGWGGHTTHTWFCLSHASKVLCGLVDHFHPIPGEGELLQKTALVFP